MSAADDIVEAFHRLKAENSKLKAENRKLRIRNRELGKVAKVAQADVEFLSAELDRRPPRNHLPNGVYFQDATET